MKKILKKIIGFLLGNNFAFNILRFINRNKLLIIYYHRIVYKEELIDIDDINMYTDIADFDSQMSFLKEHYRVVSEQEVIDFIKHGRCPKYSVWITFDDGYKDNYTNVYPILKKYNIPATFFVTTGYVNKTAKPSEDCGDAIFMDWQEIKEAAQNGITIGAHTVSHRILSQLSEAELEKEIIDPKKEIEQRLGRRVYSFAYPIGKEQDFVLEKCIPILEKNDFKLAVTTLGGFNKIGQHNFNLRRMGVSHEDTLNFFKFKVSLGSFWQR